MKSIITLLSLTCLLFITGCVSNNNIPRKAPAYQTFISNGQSFPLQNITTIDGENIDLTQPQKRKLIVLFATWCSDSNRALKALNQSHILNDPTIEIVAIAREESVETVKEWRDKHSIKVPLASDADRSIYKQFASAGIPRFIMVNQDNKIIRMELAEGTEQLKLIKWQ